MLKIVSYSLWGNNKIYYDGILSNYKIIEKLLPDYTMRIYVESIIDYTKWKEYNIQFVPVVSLGPFHGMYWRFMACEDADVALIRDLDSRISQREIELIKEWEKSDKNFHIIRDHPLHKMPIMGGTWGCKGMLLKEIHRLIKEHGNFLNYGDDQVFLKNIIFPLVKDVCLEHCSCGFGFTSDHKPFNKSIDGSFIGERIGSDELPLYSVDRKINLLNETVY